MSTQFPTAAATSGRLRQQDDESLQSPFHSLFPHGYRRSSRRTLSASVYQIHNDFTNVLTAFAKVPYDVLDVEVKQFDDDFYDFRCQIKELERRLGSVLNQGFDDCATVFAAFERACEGGTEGEASESASSESASSSSSSAAVLDALRFARCSNAPRYYAPTLLSHLGASLERRVTTYENWWPTTRKVPKRYAAQEARAAFVDVQKKTSRDALLDGGAAAAAAFSRACGRFRSGPAARWDPRDEGAVMPCWLFAARFTPRAGAKIARFAATRAGYR